MDSFVSIIIPVYRDWERLALCVEALTNQTYAKENFEVLIVNNDPEDAMPQNFCLPENFQMITEPKPGSYAARNTGLRQAKGAVIGFTDSDCIPETNWIKNALDYLNANEWCSRVAGNILVFSNSKKPTLVELYNNVYSFPQRWHVEKIGTSVTANLFTYKYVFDKVGYFDEALMSMGDSRWAKLAGAAGYKLAYVENVVVRHPARNFRQLAKKERRLGGAEGTFRKKSPSRLRNIYAYLHNLRPRKREIEFLKFQGEGLPKIDKVLLYALRYYFLIIRGYERLRVQLGKKPNRA